VRPSSILLTILPSSNAKWEGGGGSWDLPEAINAGGGMGRGGGRCEKFCKLEYLTLNFLLHVAEVVETEPEASRMQHNNDS
jgi:hypothetical protein